MKQPTTLTATLAQNDKELSIAWTFVNNAEDGVYVCVRTNVDGEPNVAPYTYLSDNDAALAVTFRRMPLPRDRHIYTPVIPFYRLLEPGQTIHETCAVPLPARELHAYAEREYPDNPIPIRVSKVAFSVQYFWLKDKRFARPAKTDPALFRASGASLALLETSLGLDRPVTVLKRTDKSFYRP
jgi:hypothetical protein